MRLRPQGRERLTLGYEPEGESVVTPALACGRRAVAERVALVASAADAAILGPRQDQLEVGLPFDVTWDGLCETRPARSTLKLGFG